MDQQTSTKVWKSSRSLYCFVYFVHIFVRINCSLSPSLSPHVRARIYPFYLFGHIFFEYLEPISRSFPKTFSKHVCLKKQETVFPKKTVEKNIEFNTFEFDVLSFDVLSRNHHSSDENLRIAEWLILRQRLRHIKGRNEWIRCLIEMTNVIHEVMSLKKQWVAMRTRFHRLEDSQKDETRRFLIREIQIQCWETGLL